MVLTNAELVSSLQKEVRILLHLAGKVDRTRPLCPYPQVAMYKGSGSIDDAANFTCRVTR